MSLTGKYPVGRESVMFELLKKHRDAYLTEWYYCHPWRPFECWQRSLLGNIHRWWLLRHVSEMIDTPLLEYLRCPFAEWRGYKYWMDKYDYTLGRIV